VRTPKSKPDDPADNTDRKAFDEDKGEDARGRQPTDGQDAELEGPLVDRHTMGCLAIASTAVTKMMAESRCGHRPISRTNFEIAGELAGRRHRKIVGRGCQSCPYSRNPIGVQRPASSQLEKGHGALAPEHLLKSPPRKRNNGNVWLSTVGRLRCRRS